MKDGHKKAAEQTKAMQVNPYTRVVSLPVHSEHIFHFPHGLPAFEEAKEFIFVFKPDTKPFIFMHAIEPAGLSFVCVDPFRIHPNYHPRISPADVDFLQAKDPEDIMLLSIVTVHKEVEETTANLQGPIAVNIRTSIGKQIICEGNKYSVRYGIWDALEELQRREEYSIDRKNKQVHAIKQ